MTGPHVPLPDENGFRHPSIPNAGPDPQNSAESFNVPYWCACFQAWQPPTESRTCEAGGCEIRNHGGDE